MDWAGLFWFVVMRAKQGTNKARRHRERNSTKDVFPFVIIAFIVILSITDSTDGHDSLSCQRSYVPTINGATIPAKGLLEVPVILH